MNSDASDDQIQTWKQTDSDLNKIWKDKRLSLQIKMRLYRSRILATLLYGAEFQHVMVANSEQRVDGLRFKIGKSMFAKIIKNVKLAHFYPHCILNYLNPLYLTRLTQQYLEAVLGICY